MNNYEIMNVKSEYFPNSSRCLKIKTDSSFDFLLKHLEKVNIFSLECH